MGQVPTIVGLVGGIFGVLASVAAALVYLKMGMAKTTIDLYREDNDALRARQDTMEHANREKDEKIAHLEGKIQALEEERAILRDMVTGRSALDKMASLLDKEFAEIKSLLLKVTSERRGS